jgi:hypothetical protein
MDKAVEAAGVKVVVAPPVAFSIDMLFCWVTLKEPLPVTDIVLVDIVKLLLGPTFEYVALAGPVNGTFIKNA